MLNCSNSPKTTPTRIIISPARARWGLDDMAVVDPQLRVYGVDGLRVADASVMPVVPSGNCHAAIMMIAERGADLIKADHGIS